MNKGMSGVMGKDGFWGFRKYVLTYQMKLRSKETMTSQVLQKTFK